MSDFARKPADTYRRLQVATDHLNEDLNFGCEERSDDAPVMVIVTLVDLSGKK